MNENMINYSPWKITDAYKAREILEKVVYPSIRNTSPPLVRAVAPPNKEVTFVIVGGA